MSRRDDLLALLRPPAHRGPLIAAGAVLFTVGILLEELRLEDELGWGATETPARGQPDDRLVRQLHDSPRPRLPRRRRWREVKGAQRPRHPHRPRRRRRTSRLPRQRPPRDPRFRRGKGRSLKSAAFSPG